MDPEDIFKRFFSSPFPEFGPRGFGLVQSCLVKIKYVAASPDPDVRHLVQRWRTTQRRRAGCWRAAAVDLKLFSDRACDCQDGLSNGNTITKKTNRTLGLLQTKCLPGSGTRLTDKQTRVNRLCPETRCKTTPETTVEATVPHRNAKQYKHFFFPKTIES